MLIRKSRGCPDWLVALTKRTAETLLTDAERKKLKIRLVFQDLQDEDTLGDCQWNEFSYSTVIRLCSSMHAKDLASTLVHEMVHVKQQIRHELIGLRDNKWMWMGKIYVADALSEKAWNMPWEIEARTVESTLTKKLLTELINKTQHA